MDWAIAVLLAMCLYELWKIQISLESLGRQPSLNPTVHVTDPASESYIDILQAQTQLLEKMLEKQKSLIEIQENTSTTGVLNDQLYHIGEKIVNVGARVTELERYLLVIDSSIVRMSDKLGER